MTRSAKMKIKFISMTLIISVALTGCNNFFKKKNTKVEESKDSPTSILKEEDMQRVQNIVRNLTEEPVFDIVTSMGTIKVKLYGKTPLHRENFAKLAISGFYDGLLFHRVINGFMIQGGDPLTKDSSMVAYYGTGGPDYTIPAEFVPEYKHLKGALAAARRGDMANPKKESSGSQFYIVQDEKACAQLDGEYTVFGQTVEGFDVIDKIAQVRTDAKDRPVNDVKIIKIYPDPASVKEPAANADSTKRDSTKRDSTKRDSSKINL